MTQGPPPHTSCTVPVFRKIAFCLRASALLRGSECGSRPSVGGVLPSGGAGEPLSQMIIAEPSWAAPNVGMPQ